MCRVLLVEDDAMNVLAFRRLLEFEGIQVDSVDTVEAALAALGRTPYASIVADLRLPGVSGQELARRLRATRLIALSGDVRGIEQVTHFDVALRKPCQPELLVRAILGGGD